jgi:hypothetical protein
MTSDDRTEVEDLATGGRWAAICEVLIDPHGNAVRLTLSLERLPYIRRQHLLPDDAQGPRQRARLATLRKAGGRS